jgi:hypothetical protein
MDRILTHLVLLTGFWTPLTAAAVAHGNEPSREERLAAMRGIAERFKVRTADAGEPRELSLHEAPLLRFDDPAREFHDASLWAWGSPGRPACLLAMEQYGGQRWFELISLAPGKLTAEAASLKWTPPSPGLELQGYPDAPRPAREAVRRLSQMKDLLGKLQAHEVGRTGMRYELRLMPKPLLRYSNADDNLHDGAIFAFAYGTNPELLAVVEATGETAATATWQIGFARCGAAELHVVLNEKEIFRLPYAAQTGPKDAYWNFPFQFRTSGE